MSPEWETPRPPWATVPDLCTPSRLVWARRKQPHARSHSFFSLISTNARHERPRTPLPIPSTIPGALPLGPSTAPPIHGRGRCSRGDAAAGDAPGAAAHIDGPAPLRSPSLASSGPSKPPLAPPGPGPADPPRIPRASRPAVSGRCLCRGDPPRLTCMAREKKTPASDASFFTLNSMAAPKPLRPRRAPAVTAPAAPPPFIPSGDARSAPLKRAGTPYRVRASRQRLGGRGRGQRARPL